MTELSRYLFDKKRKEGIAALLLSTRHGLEEVPFRRTVRKGELTAHDWLRIPVTARLQVY